MEYTLETLDTRVAADYAAWRGYLDTLTPLQAGRVRTSLMRRDRIIDGRVATRRDYVLNAIYSCCIGSASPHWTTVVEGFDTQTEYGFACYLMRTLFHEWVSDSDLEVISHLFRKPAARLGAQQTA